MYRIQVRDEGSEFYRNTTHANASLAKAIETMDTFYYNIEARIIDTDTLAMYAYHRPNIGI